MSELLEQIKHMTPEEQAELAAVLDAAQKKTEAANRPVVQQPCMRNPHDLDEHGMKLSPEAIWDRDHPLIRKPYGYYEMSFNAITGQKTRRNWSRAEVEAYNRPVEEAWLAEKRKLFPEAQLPPNYNMGEKKSGYSEMQRG